MLFSLWLTSGYYYDLLQCFVVVAKNVLQKVFESIASTALLLVRYYCDDFFQPEGGAVVVQHDADDDVEPLHCPKIHRHNCCIHLRQCVESSAFSFTLGIALLITGVCLIGATSKVESNHAYLVGPFCLAAGCILIIRGCINEIAKRQQRRADNNVCHPLFHSSIYIKD